MAAPLADLWAALWAVARVVRRAASKDELLAVSRAGCWVGRKVGRRVA